MRYGKLYRRNYYKQQNNKPAEPAFLKQEMPIRRVLYVTA